MRCDLTGMSGERSDNRIRGNRQRCRRAQLLRFRAAGDATESSDAKPRSRKAGVGRTPVEGGLSPVSN